MSYEHNKKWRKKYPKKRNKDRGEYYKKRREKSIFRKKSYSLWTAEEIEIITSNHRPSDTELAKLIGRSVQAIQVMRAKILRKNILG